jgi:hypothetical protein
MEQKMDYLHNNPVEAGFVSEPQHWKYSSVGDYVGSKGNVEIEQLDCRKSKSCWIDMSYSCANYNNT